MKLYTKTGDNGTTSFFGSQRMSKGSIEAEVLGSLDELNAVLGIAKEYELDSHVQKILFSVQNELFNIGAELVTVGKEVKGAKTFKLLKSKVTSLETKIDLYSKKLSPIKTFILPGGSKSSSFIHLARTVCRRTERGLVLLSEASPVNKNLLMYLNRLSDLLFVLARYSNFLQNTKDVIWKK